MINQASFASNYFLKLQQFFDKVFQYKKILPEELCDDLFKHSLVSSSKSNVILGPSRVIEKINNIDSKIISNKHIELISKWIDKIDTSEELSTSYEFKL